MRLPQAMILAKRQASYLDKDFYIVQKDGQYTTVGSNNKSDILALIDLGFTIVASISYRDGVFSVSYRYANGYFKHHVIAKTQFTLSQNYGCKKMMRLKSNPKKYFKLPQKAYNYAVSVGG